MSNSSISSSSSESVSDFTSNNAQKSLLRHKKRDINMEARTEHQLVKQYRALYCFTTAIGLTLVLLVFVWIVSYCGGFGWTDVNLQFNWHPFLMSLGMIFCFGQSILIYRTKRETPKKTLKILHGVIHALAYFCALFALITVFNNHNYSNPPKANLYTMHSWIGLTAVIIFVAQLVFGCVTFLYPGLNSDLRKIILPVHVAMGTGAFFLATGAAFMGLTEKSIWKLGASYEKMSSEAYLVNFICVLLAIFAAMTLYLVSEPKYKRLAMPEDEIVLATTANN